MAMDQHYADKPQQYYTGERRDIVDRLSTDLNRKILEIGCGAGLTGAYAKRTQKCGSYVGIELHDKIAELAKSNIDHVHVGNVETLELPYPDHFFDVLVASEVLEHLVDPWTALSRLHRKMKTGAVVYASSPNIAHRSTLRMLIDGNWKLEASGRMDKTHLRWFTPKSYAEMFEQAGYSVSSVEPLTRQRFRAQLLDVLTFKKFSHLFMSQIFITAVVK